jgi:hypothetical protein
MGSLQEQQDIETMVKINYGKNSTKYAKYRGNSTVLPEAQTS